MISTREMAFKLRELIGDWARYEQDENRTQLELLYVAATGAAVYFILQAFGAPDWLAVCGLVAFPVLCLLFVRLVGGSRAPTSLSLSAKSHLSPKNDSTAEEGA